MPATGRDDSAPSPDRSPCVPFEATPARGGGPRDRRIPPGRASVASAREEPERRREAVEVRRLADGPDLAAAEEAGERGRGEPLAERASVVVGHAVEAHAAAGARE